MIRLVFLAVLVFTPLALSQECPEAMCMMYCEHGFEQDEHGCDVCSCRPPPHEVYSDICEDVTCTDGVVCKTFSLTSSRHLIARCVDPYTPNRCQQPMDVGPCKKSVEKWYYNTETGHCDKYLYGGCRGNDNRYETETNCRLMCVPEIEPREPGECPALKCTACASGYKQDRYGCGTCECIDQSVDCLEISCYMACEHGFIKDIRGCDACSCAPEPVPYEDPCANQGTCLMACPHGFEKNENGCDVCKCRDTPPCLNIQCTMQCDYGFAKSWDGCSLCECAQNPCNAVDCPSEQYCEPKFNNNFWEPTCVGLHAAKPWCMGKAQCTSYCPHGYQSDQQGCATCSCMTGISACTRMACVETCPYGNKYDSKGCMTCECLPNPCKEKDCMALGYDACEAVHKHANCETCPATSKCLLSRQVRQVRIRLDYAHDALDDHINFKTLHGILRAHIVELTEVENDNIKGFKVWRLHDETVAVEYYIITFGNHDLVKITKQFTYDIENQELHVTYQDARFVPQQHTLTHRYYSALDYPDEMYHTDHAEEVRSTQALIIVAVVASVVVAVVVIAVVIFAATRSKGKNTGTHNSRLIYKKVPNSNGTQAQLTKKSQPVGDVATA